MRNFIRHPADISIKIIENESVDHYHQPIQDIGISGLRCHSNKPLTVGAEIKIIIDVFEPVMEISCIVVW